MAKEDKFGTVPLLSQRRNLILLPVREMHFGRGSVTYTLDLIAIKQSQGVYEDPRQ